MMKWQNRANLSLRILRIEYFSTLCVSWDDEHHGSLGGFCAHAA